MKSKQKGIALRPLLAICCAIVSTPGSTLAYPQQQSTTPTSSTAGQTAKIPPEQLDSLVAPIALYPDNLLAQVLADPHSTVPNLGASGAIAAVMGAFLVTYPRDQIRTLLFIFVFARIRLIPAALLIGFWFLTQLFHAGAVAQVQTGGVAYLAHIGGFVFGAVTAHFFEDSRRVA